MDNVVYVLITKGLKDLTPEPNMEIHTESFTEVNAVFKDKDKANDMGEWLLKQGKVGNMEYFEYNIQEMLIL